MHVKTTLVVLLTAAVLLTGCTVFGGDGDDGPDVRSTPADGLSLTFSALQSTFQEREDIALRLAIANTGEREARDIVAELYGPLSFNEQTCGELRRGAGLSLPGVDKEAEQDGGDTAVEWMCDNTIDLPAGETQQVEAGAAVAYGYTTTASAEFRVVPREQFTGTSSAVTTENTDAPVKADIGLSSPVTIAPDPVGTGPEPTFNISRVIADPDAGTITVVFNHDIDTNDFDLLPDLRAFEITEPSGVSIDTDSLDVEGDRVVFPVSGSFAGTDLTLEADATWLDLETTANDQAFTGGECTVSVEDGRTESTSCSDQSWETATFYWQDFRIVEEDGEATAELRLSQDITDFRAPDDLADAIELEADSDADTNALNLTGNLRSSGNVLEFDLEKADRDLSDVEYELTWLSRSGFELRSADTGTAMDLGSCSATVGAGWKGFNEAGERHCASSTRAYEVDDGPGVTVPITVQNVGDGTPADIEEEPVMVEVDPSLPNAPSGTGVTTCNGESPPLEIELFEGARDITCRVTMPEEAYDTQLVFQVDLDYRYFETTETRFTVEGVS